MPLDFPSSPTTGQKYTAAGAIWTWDGTSWQGTSSNTGVLAIRVFTTSGTYTPTPGMVNAIIECVGGGGAGGAWNTSAAGQLVVSGGGGAGGYSRKFATAAQIGASQTVTIGAGGVGASGSNGGNGGVTGVGSLCAANGGQGGSQYLTGGAGGLAGIGDVIGGGAPGGTANNTNPAVNSWTGVGGSTLFGSGGTSPSAGSGQAFNGNGALGYGAGGGGATNFALTSSLVGGSGAPGIVIITEYGVSGVTSGPYVDASAAPQCGRLILGAASPTNTLKFIPYAGDRIKINGTIYPIPAAGITIPSTGVMVNGTAGQNLVSGTYYYLFLFADSAGVLTPDFRSVAAGNIQHSTSATAGNVGIEIRTGDDTRTLIGMLIAGGTVPNVFYDDVGRRLVRTWFNRRRTGFQNSASGAAAPTSGSYVPIGTVAQWLNWAGELVTIDLAGNAYTTVTATTIYGTLWIDGVGNGTGGNQFIATPGAYWGLHAFYQYDGLAEVTVHSVQFAYQCSDNTSWGVVWYGQIG